MLMIDLLRNTWNQFKMIKKSKSDKQIWFFYNLFTALWSLLQFNIESFSQSVAGDGNLIHLTAKYDKTIQSFCCKISSSVKNSLNVEFGDHIVLRANSREIALRVNHIYDNDNDNDSDQELIYIGD